MSAYTNYQNCGGRIGYEITSEPFDNRVDGAFIKKSSTGSAQLTGTGNGTFIYDIDQGFVFINGQCLEIDAAVDQACEAAGNILANGEAKIYMLTAYLSPDGTIIRKTIEGAVAAAASVVVPTVDEITAAVPVGAPWVCLGLMKITRTGDTAVTEEVDNKYRPMMRLKGVQF